jgi:uncharacterized membrane protein YedE/YeeE
MNIPFADQLIGGALIGLAGALLMRWHGRIFGVSGIVGALVKPETQDRAWRLSLVGGLVAGGVILRFAYPDAFSPMTGETPILQLVIAGFLVGLGSVMGSGCTSGHGICGISRLSKRSIIATMTFMAAGAVTVFAVKTFFGQGG